MSVELRQADSCWTGHRASPLGIGTPLREVYSADPGSASLGQACFPVVNEIIQKPLEDAKEELTAWVLCPEANESQKRFLTAREIWWSSSMSSEVIINGFKWTTTFALPTPQDTTPPS
jgi:hypothetical protein